MNIIRFSYRGLFRLTADQPRLTPHKFTPMPGVHQSLYVIKIISGILLIFLMVTASACAEKKSSEKEKENTKPSGERIIRITFDLKGDDIGSPEYQGVLHKIVTSIREKEAGEIMSSGFGMGNMNIVMRIKGEESIKEIQKIITDNYPKASYRMEQSFKDRDASRFF